MKFVIKQSLSLSLSLSNTHAHTHTNTHTVGCCVKLYYNFCISTF